MIDDVKLLELGTRVTFSHVLDRRVARRSGDNRKEWASRRDAPNAGVVIGLRTLSDGRVRYNGWEDPIEFTPDRWFPAILVAYNLRRRPVLVLPEHATAAEPVRPADPEETVAAIRDAARAGVDSRLEWPSLHWRTEDVHPDAWPQIVNAAVDGVLDSGHVRLIERTES